MGTSQSQPLLDQLSGYKILKKSPQNNTTHLSHVQTDKQYLLRQLTYTDQSLYNKNLQQHKQRQIINDDHLTHLSRVQGKQIDHLCSNLYKIYAMWEYPYRTLAQQINQHLYQNRKFQDKQIWSILASSILALSTLQKNKIKNQMLTTRTILIDSQGLIKIADPLSTGLSTNLQSVHRNRNIQNIYLSPQQCQILQSHGSYTNSYRSDVWIMGMIILQCGLLQSMGKCYKDQYQRIDYQLINNKLQEFGNQYGQQLKLLVQTMLRRDSKDRPDWVDLQPYARKLQPQGASVYGSSNKKQGSLLNSDNKNNNNNNNNLSPFDKQKNQQSSYVSFPNSLTKTNNNITNNFNTNYQVNNNKGDKVSTTYQNVNITNQPYYPNTVNTTNKPVYTNNITTFQQPATTTTTSTNFNIPIVNPPIKQTTYQQPTYSNIIPNQTIVNPSQYTYVQSPINPIITPSNINTNYSYSNNIRNYQTLTSTTIPTTSTFVSTNTNQYLQPIVQQTPLYSNSSNSPSSYISPANSFGFRPTQYVNNIGTTLATGNLFPNPTTTTTVTTNTNTNVNNTTTNTNTTIGNNLMSTAQFGVKPYQSWKSTIPSSTTTTITTNPLLKDIPKFDDYKTDYTKLQIYKKDYNQPLTTTSYTSSLPYSSSSFNTNTLLGNKPAYSPINTNINTNTSAYTSTNNNNNTNTNINTNTNTNTNSYTNNNTYTSNNSSNYSNTQNLFTPPSLLYQTAQLFDINNNQIYKKQVSDNTANVNKGQSYGQTNTTYNQQNYQSSSKQKNQSVPQSITKPLLPVKPTLTNPTNQQNQSLEHHINTVQSNNQQTYVDMMQQNSNLTIQPNLNNTNSQIGNVNQQPQFVIQTFKQGSKYQGYKLKDMRHGQGKFYYQDGGMYDGNWKNNKMDGYGSLYYQSGELAYQGMWKNDQFHGKGKLFNEFPYSFQGGFDYQNFDEIDQYWAYYQGDFVSDFKKGQGKLMLSNGQYFEGTFDNDMVEGPGVFYCKNGKTVKGIWKQNHLFSQ